MRLLFAIAILCLCSCTRNENAAVPRRTAYPRVYSYDSVYVQVPEFPLILRVNASAPYHSKVRADGSIWMDVDYTHYDAKLYITITPIDGNSVSDVLDNRTERINLNLGGAPADISDFTNEHGYYSSIITSPTAIATPIQFLSLNKNAPKWLVSGAIFFDNASSISSADSVAPILDILSRDIREMLNSISAP